MSMKKVVAGLFMSLDGVVESPDKWQFDSFDDDMGAEVDALIAETDTVLLGRTTCEEWASYWPATTEDLDFASYINDAPKYVVSATLEEPLEWRNSTLVKGDVAEAIGELKSQPGKDIAVQGSPTLVRSLLENDLLDELTLMIPRRRGRKASLRERSRPEETSAHGHEDDPDGGRDPHLRTERPPMTINRSEYVTEIADLPGGENAVRFDGHEHGASVSFFITRNKPGTGPKLHKRPYDETFIMQEGEARFAVGEESIEAAAREIVGVPANTPHGFVNTDEGVLRQVNIHASPRMETEWLE